MSKNGFDILAPWYESIVSITTLGQLPLSKKHFLKDIDKNSNVLLVGGGSGAELIEILNHGFQGNIIYLDSSPKMIEIAGKVVKSKFPSQSGNVKFICKPVEDYMPEIKVDYVITNYFLDLFTIMEVRKIITVLSSALKPGGKWLIADFNIRDVNSLKKAVFELCLKLLYLFFFIFCGISGKKLIGFKEEFINADFKHIRSKKFLFGFLIAEQWQKSF